MTTTELSEEFDILYNNITSNQAPGLSEYEKSVFLTQAQEAIITELYNGNLKDSFESSEAYTRYLSSIVEHATPTLIEGGDKSLSYNNVSCKEYTLDNNVLFIIYEQATVGKNTAIVVPTPHDVLFNTLNNPFKGPNNRRILRVSRGKNIELYYYNEYNLNSYSYRYIKKPDDVNLSEEKGLSTPEILHRTILLRAVQLAKAVWQS